MSAVKVKQLCELFRQIAEGILTGEAVQETIERGWELALSQLKKRIQTQAYSEARALSDPLQKAAVLLDLAAADQNVEALNEIYELVSGLENPDLDFAAMTRMTDNPDFYKWCVKQALRISDPYQRALRLTALAPEYFGVQPDASDLLDQAVNDFRGIPDKQNQNTARIAIIEANAKLKDFTVARKIAERIGKSFWKARAYIKIYQFSRDEDDHRRALAYTGEVTDYWKDDLRRQLAIVLCEFNKLPRAFELLEQMQMRDWKPYVLLVIVEAAIKNGDKPSIAEALDLLRPNPYRWWLTLALIRVAGAHQGDKKKKITEARMSIGALQNAGHRAVAYAELAAISRTPGDLECANMELHSIMTPGERLKTAVEIIKTLQ